MAVQQSNNLIPNIHPVINMYYGENYWFGGCAKYVMEALGEPEMDYWFFSGLTGDSLAQVYSYNRFRGDGAADYRLSDGDPQLVLDVFETAGYASSFVAEKELCANREMYVKTLTSYIDRGVPVIFNLWRNWSGFEHGFGWGVFVGYEDCGKTLLFLTADKSEPERMPVSAALPDSLETPYRTACGWIFVGKKKRQADIAKIYREAVLDMPRLLTLQTDGYCFGAEAFRAWAKSIEDGRFDGMAPEEYNDWTLYKIYVCNTATNGSCRTFLERALEKNPDMFFLKEVLECYKNLEALWHGRPGDSGAENLESLGGGFNVTLKILQDPEQRRKIADIIREGAVCYDKIVDIIKANS